MTRKLKTQKLEENNENEETSSAGQATLNEAEEGQHQSDSSDSGTESDDEHDEEDGMTEGMAKQLIMVPRRSPATSPPYPGHTFVPLPVTPSEDNYSSEEELKEIINEQSVKEKSKKSPSKKDKSKNPKGGCSPKTGSLGSQVPVASNIATASAASANVAAAATVAEKRKWSEVISDDDLADLEDDDAGLELELTMQRSSRLYVRSSGGASTTTASMSSSCSNDDADSGCLCGRRSKLTTPVQFCTSPPMDVHRPRRKPWTPPPPKVFHVMTSNHSASFDLTTQEEDDEIVDIENRAKPRPAAFMPVNTGSSGNAATSVKNGMRPVSAGLIEHEANGSSQYCPRHHHHTTQTTQQPQQRQTPSPNKRHRLTPRPPNIQRPCLDFEKMQQIKKHVVTSWRPQGAELSLFCW